MKIHFCDLCNESVPQSDVEGGRAFLRKGRVVCAKCDALMSSMQEEESAAGAAPALAAFHGASPVGSTPSPVHQVGRAPRGNGAGIGIAVVALLLAGAVAVWGWDELRAQRDSAQVELSRVRGDLQETRAQLAQTDLILRQAREEDAQQHATLERAASEHGARVEQRLRATEDLDTRTSASLVDFGTRLEVLEAHGGEIRRHDAELVRLQQRYSVLADELREVRDLVAEVAASLQERPRATTQEAGAGAPAAAGEPAWLGLIEGLSSKSSNERWMAVKALEETRDPAAAEHLLPLLQDDDVFIRLSTARALGILRSPASIGALIASLEDAEAAVRETAYLSLRGVSGRDFPFDPMSSDVAERAKRIRVWQDWWKKERERLPPS